MTRHQTRLFFAVPSRESEEEGETRRKLKKERLVNKLELFLADVYASRIEGSIFPPPLSSLGSRSRSRVVRRLCPEGGQQPVLGFL